MHGVAVGDDINAQRAMLKQQISIAHILKVKPANGLLYVQHHDVPHAASLTPHAQLETHTHL